jgi:HEAT repeat protein
MAGDAFDRFERAVEEGTEGALAAWVQTGREGLEVLRSVLDGSVRVPDLPAGIHPRDAIDNTAALVAAIAAAHPDAFLEVFADDGMDADSHVLIGLGQIDDPRATKRLAHAAHDPRTWLRMEAAIGLGRRAAPLATAALTALLEDPEYLVRYHALKSLARIGGAEALPALRRFTSDIPIERTLANDAIEAIERRVSGEEPSR